MEETFGVSAFRTPKKPRGRPRKANKILLPAEMTVLGVLQTASTKRQSKAKATATKSSCHDSLRSDGKQSDLVGKAVHGVVDGSFDAGFLVSLRVGESKNVYRGAVFGPGLRIPLPKNSDVPEKANASQREQTPDSPDPPPAPPSPTPPPADRSFHPASSTISFSSFFNGIGSSNSDLRQLSASKQDPASTPFQLHSSFVHPASSVPSATQGFGTREFYNPYSLKGTEIAYGRSMFGAGAQADG